jgi:hypothetical protein
VCGRTACTVRSGGGRNQTSRANTAARPLPPTLPLPTASLQGQFSVGLDNGASGRSFTLNRAIQTASVVKNTEVISGAL